MSLRSQLRLSNSTQMMLERARHHYPGREVIETNSEARYLQLQLSDEYSRSVSAFFDVELWLQNMDSHLPGIPWQHVPLRYLTRWLNTLQLSFMVEGVIWTVENITLPEQPVPTRLLSLTAEPCAVLCLEWPSQVEEQNKTGMSLSELPLRLRYVLGKSQAPLSVLNDLVPGDLLVIRQQSYYLTVGNQKLFSFSYQGNDEVTVEQSIFDNQHQEYMEEEHLLDWTKLPVDIEFVLDSHAITLGKLNNIDTGSVLPVSSGAEQRIKIYLNRKFFALGELVALEGGGLAVEVGQINMRPENQMSEPDAE